jgi:hypothetical protein
MKTIEEAKDDCILDCGCLNYRESDYTAGYAGGIDYGFEAGVEFAQRWISVEDELPDFDKSKYPNGDFEIFLVKMATGSINYKIKYCVANLIAEGRWSCEFDWNVVTHWRPIELK